MNQDTAKAIAWVIVGILSAITLSWASSAVVQQPVSWLWPVRTVGSWVAFFLGVGSVAAFPYKTRIGRAIGVILAAVVGAVVILISIAATPAINNISYIGSAPNYAIKVTSVRILLQSFTSGASAPYFGC